MDIERIAEKHGITDVSRIEAFGMVVLDKVSYTGTAKSLGVHVNTVRKWSQEKWWVEAQEKVLKEVYKSFKSKMLMKANEVVDSLVDDVVLGDRDKTASAKAALLKTFASMTEDALIKPGGGDVNVNIDQRSVNIGENVDMERLMKEGTLEEKKEAAMGNVPTRFLKGD